MPKEYTSCVDSYVAKGVSEKAAKARCAAMFFKRHGVTVNEWVKKNGEGTEHDYDDEMMTAILSATEPPAVHKCEKHKQLYTNVKAIDASHLDDGLIEIIAARNGSLVYTDEGIGLTWTSQALKGAEKSWIGTPVSINHTTEEHGVIKSSWFEDKDEGLHQIIKLDDYLKGWVQRNIGEIGVSIEGFLNEFDDDLNILNADGKGVTVVLPPHRPACSKEEGCKVLGTEIEPKIPTNKIEDEVLDENAQINSEDVNMANEKEDKTVITAEQFEAVKAEKAKVEADMEAIKAKMADLEAFKTNAMLVEKNSLMATIKDFGLDPAVYEKNDNDALKLIVATVSSYKKVIEDDPIVDSGAKVVKATKKEEAKTAEQIEADEVYEHVYGKK